MFVPKYIISHSILKNVGIIDASKEVIETAPLISSWETKLKKNTFERSVYHSTHLEGNRLSEDEVKEILDGRDVLGRDRDIIEIENYKRVLQFSDAIFTAIGPKKPYLLTIETILEMHRIISDRVLHSDVSGKFRTGQVAIRNTQTGKISYTPPPAAEISYLIEDLVNWINDRESKQLHPVLKAGIIHYELSRIHPFLDGNGRTARVLSTLVLNLDGYDIKHFYSLDEYFDQSPMEYYVTLQEVSNQLVLDTNERDITPWLEYFIKGMAEELVSIKNQVKRVSTESRVKDKLGDEVELNERQMLIIEYLHRHGSMMNKDFRKMFPDFSDDTVLRELKFLKQKGLVKKVGGTKKAQYVLK